MTKQRDKGSGGTKPDSGAYPGRYDVPALKERRYLWTARLFASIAIASIIANVSLSMAIFGLTPLKEVRPYLVQFAESSDVVSTIRPITKTMEGLDLLTGSLVREYVILRNTVVRSQEEMQRRWALGGKLHLMTQREAYNTFVNTITPLLDDLRRNDMTQEVRIVSVSAFRTNRLYQVDFTVVRRDRHEQIVSEQDYVATLEVTYEPKSVTGDQIYLNPTGFTVLNYTLARKAQ